MKTPDWTALPSLIPCWVQHSRLPHQGPLVALLLAWPAVVTAQTVAEPAATRPAAAGAATSLDPTGPAASGKAAPSSSASSEQGAPTTAAMPLEPNPPTSAEQVAPADGSAAAGAVAPPAQPVAEASGNAQWEAALESARVDLLAGRFALATRQLTALVASAPTPVERARAEELLRLSNAWARRDIVLVEQRELAGTDLLSRRSDLRTSDEIGVLYLSSIVYGLGTGLLIDMYAEPNSASGIILPPLLVAGAAVGGVAVMDSGTGLRYGTAQSISAGMSIGFWQGLAWGTYYQATSSYDDQMEEETYATLLWGTTTTGAVAGGVIGSVNSTTPGRAAFVGSATMWPAVVFGLGAGGLSTDDDYRDDSALLASAIGASLGTLGGVLAAGEVSPTTARVRFLDLGGLGGGLAVGGLTVALRAEDTEDGSEILLATDLGIVAGLGLAWWLTDDMPRDLGAQKRETARATITPTMIPQRGGMGLGAVGTF